MTKIYLCGSLILIINIIFSETFYSFNDNIAVSDLSVPLVLTSRCLYHVQVGKYHCVSPMSALLMSYESYWKGCSFLASPLLQPLDSFCISKAALLGPSTVTVLSSDLTAVLKDPLLCGCIWKNCRFSHWVWSHSSFSKSLGKLHWNSQFI